jgi:hypothetical protein
METRSRWAVARLNRILHGHSTVETVRVPGGQNGHVQSRALVRAEIDSKTLAQAFVKLAETLGPLPSPHEDEAEGA